MNPWPKGVLPFSPEQSALGQVRSRQTQEKRRLQRGVLAWIEHRGKRKLVRISNRVRVSQRIVIPKAA